MKLWRGLQFWLFYRYYPSFRGPVHPHWVGTNNVEYAWRFAEDLGIPEAQGRRRISLDHEQRGWAP